MKDYGPKPIIEQHHHIQELIDRQQVRSDDRTFHRERIKALEEREDLIKDSKEYALTDFWCDTCKEDFKAVAIRQIEVDWSCPTQRIAFYKTKCFRRHWCIRLITDRHKDGFYLKSKFVNLDRGNHYADTVQPFETGFNLLYGKR